MNIVIISGSTRTQNNTHRVALALEKHLNAHTQHRVSVVDLAEYLFPAMQEVLVRQSTPSASLIAFKQIITEADALIFATPEYNGGYSAALKNAVDYLKEGEFKQKVIGVASVSTGMLGGIRAALDTQQLILGIHGYPLPQMLTVPTVTSKLDENGNLIDENFHKNIEVFCNAFLWLAEAVCEKKKG